VWPSLADGDGRTKSGHFAQILISAMEGGAARRRSFDFNICNAAWQTCSETYEMAKTEGLLYDPRKQRKNDFPTYMRHKFK